MKKRSARIALLCLAVFMICSALPLAALAATDWDVSKSKTAAELTPDFETDVTLSLPAKEMPLVSDVVFVLDKSTSAQVEQDALDMLLDLQAQVKNTGAKVQVGVVIFNKVAHSTERLYDLATEYADIEAAIRQDISSGTNSHAGLLAAQKLLEEDTATDDSRKYMIFVSDGITYLFCENGDYTVPYTRSYQYQNIDGTSKNFGGTMAELDARYGGQWAPEGGFAVWLDKIGSETVKWNGYNIEYNGGASYPAETEGLMPDEGVSNVENALWLTAELYKDLAAKYNCYAMQSGKTSGYASYPWGEDFMAYLSGGEEVTFDNIQNDIVYFLDAGSYVVDVIGDKFDFINDPSRITMKVGAEALTTVKTGENAYQFGNSEKADMFTMEYFPATETEKERFVWTANVKVTNFAPAQLTYGLVLPDPETRPGAYVEDTNEEAILYPVDSTGKEGESEPFEKPKVNYTVTEPPVSYLYKIVAHYTKYVDGVVVAEGETSVGPYDGYHNQIVSANPDNYAEYNGETYTFVSGETEMKLTTADFLHSLDLYFELRETTPATSTEPPETDITDPSVPLDPPDTEPPVTDPADTEPTVTEPPVTDPADTEPIVTEPPVTDPDVTEPTVDIDDPDVPLDPGDDIPHTGSQDRVTLLSVLLVVSAAGIVLVAGKLKRNR